MKGRKTRATGGGAPMEYTKDSNVNREALQRKRGGKAVKMEGEAAKMHAGRKPRKSGGRLKISDWSAAQSGTPPKGHSTDC